MAKPDKPNKGEKPKDFAKRVFAEVKKEGRHEQTALNETVLHVMKKMPSASLASLRKMAHEEGYGLLEFRAAVSAAKPSRK